MRLTPISVLIVILRAVVGQFAPSGTGNLSPDAFKASVAAICGNGWATILAERLGVTVRSCRRWADPDGFNYVPVPSGMPALLADMARDKIVELEKLTVQLGQFTVTGK